MIRVRAEEEPAEDGHAMVPRNASPGVHEDVAPEC